MAEFQAGEVVVPVVPDAKGWTKSLQRQVVPGSTGIGQEIGREINRGIQSSLKKIDVQVGANTAGARAQVAALSREVQQAAGLTVRVNADADTRDAQSELAALENAVSRVNGRRANVSADADTAGAQTGLAGVEAAVSRVDGRRAHVQVDVDAAGALAQLAMVSAALAALPAVAAVGLGAAGLAGAAVAAGVGIGALAAVAVPSISRISESLKQQEAAQKAATSATSGAAGAAQQAQIQALNLASAEQRVTDAKRAALAAEQELTRARIDAKRAAEDLALASRNAALSEEDALLGVEEARQRLAEVEADPKSGELERKRAELAVRQAEQRAKEASLRNKRAQSDQKAVDKAGIEGSAQVVAAKKRIEDANRRVEDAERSLRVMQLQQVAAAKQQAAANRGVAAEVVKLSPAAATLAKQWQAFSQVYESWQKKLEPTVLPVLGKGLEFVEKLLPKITPLVKGVSGALGGLIDSATKALGGKFWTDFFKDLSTAAPTAVSGLGKSLGNVVTGIAGVVKAFLPFTGTVVGGIEKATAAFATWGKNLGQSQGFKDFIAYARANLPNVISFIKNLVTLGGNVVRALAPLGSVVLAGLAGLVALLAKIPPPVLLGIAGAIVGIVIAVRVWRVAQLGLNAALKANPIGLIITAIGLLVAGLTYAYQHSETFRSIVDAAFKAIGQVASWLWENVLKPVFTALVALWQNVVAPVITWLWQSIIKPAFDAIGAAIKWAWENLIKPAVSALVLYWNTVLGPAISKFWEERVKPAWEKISAAIKTAWTSYIQPALKSLWDFIVNTLGPKVLWLHENVVKPVFEKVGQVIKFAWENVIKPAISALWTFITDTLPNGFKKGVGLVESFWNGLKEVAKKPVNFVIETVYNNGIVKLWNSVADALGLKDMKLSPLPALATGGVLPGYTPGRDTMVAAVSGGEAVMRPEWTRAVGSDFVHQANAAARRGGVSGVAGFMRDRFAGGFATGGIVGDVLAKGVKVAADAFLNPILDKVANAMGGSPWGQMLTAWPKKMVADVVKFLEGKEAAAGGPGAQKALAFARQQLGKPYKFGATGPGSFDCSGLTMRAWQAGGRSDIPRTSQQQMGWVKQISAPVPGALGFPHPGHVWLYVNPNTIIEAPQTGLQVREVAARAAQVIGVPPTEYDSGGYLPTGHSLVYNGTGSPEPVLTDQQWEALAGQTGGGDGYNGPLVENMYTTPEQSPQAIARELYWLSRSRPR